MKNAESEYNKQLGMIGLQMLELSGRERAQTAYANRGGNGRSSAMQGVDSVFETTVVGIEDRAFEPLVDRLRSTTLRFRLVGAFHDIVSPLEERLRALHEDREAKEFKRHHEDALYSDKMLAAMVSMASKSGKAQRGIYLAYQEFMRHPVWNSLIFGMRTLTATTKFGFSLAFGFKKKKTDTDRIVDAIKEQTKFHMTGEVDQSKTFWQRLRSQGAIGMLLRNLGEKDMVRFGMDRNVAQAREDARSRGEEVDGGLKGWFTDWFYSNDITKRGRNGNGKQTTEEKVDARREAEKDNLFSILQMDVSEIRKNSASQKKLAHSLLGGEIFETIQDTKDGIYKVAGHTSDTKKEVRRHRLQAFWVGMLGLGAKIFSGITGVITAVAGIAGAIIAGLKGILLGKELLSNGLNRGRTGPIVDGKNERDSSRRRRPSASKTKLLKGLTIGGLISLATGYAADELGQDTDLGAGLDVASRTAEYASYGAMAGSFVPVVGTGIGGGIGAAAGFTHGMWDNKAQLLGVDEDRKTMSGAIVNVIDAAFAGKGDDDKSLANRMFGDGFVGQAMDNFLSYTPAGFFANRLHGLATGFSDNSDVLFGEETPQQTTPIQTGPLTDVLNDIKANRDEYLSEIRKADQTNKELLAVLKDIKKNTENSGNKYISSLEDGGLVNLISNFGG